MFDIIKRKSEARKILTCEAYNVACAKIEFLLQEITGCKVILSTNLCGNTQKTAAEGLAESLSNQFGKNVLLMDCNFISIDRKKKTYSERKRFGLSEYLSSKINEIDEIIYENSFNYHIMPAGGRPYKPSDFLSKEKIDNLYINLHSKYDYIIVDAPQHDGTLDMITAMKVFEFNGAVVNVTLNKTSNKDLQKTIELMDLFKVKLLGVILSQS